METAPTTERKTPRRRRLTVHLAKLLILGRKTLAGNIPWMSWVKELDM